MSRKWIIVAVVAFTLAAGCSRSSGHRSAAPDSTVTVQPGAGPVAVGDLLVERPAGASTLVVGAKTANATGATPDGFSIAGTPFVLSAKTGADTGPVRIGLPVRAGLDPATVVVAYLDAGTWQPEPTTYDDARKVVFAETDHLSVWTTLTGEAWRLTEKVIKVVKDIVGLGEIGESPHCGSSPLPAETVKVRLGSGARPESFRVDTCAFRVGDKIHVKLADRRAIGVEVTLPSGVTRVGGSIPGAGDLAADILQGVDNQLGGHTTTLIPSGGWLELEVPTASTELDAMVNNSALVWSTAFTAAADVQGIWKAVAALATTRDVFADAGNLDWKDVIREGLSKVLEEAGRQGARGVGKLAKSVLAALLGTVFLAVRGIIDTFRFDSAHATIFVETGQPPVSASKAFYGEWHVHGGGAVFNPDGTGSTHGHIGFTNDGRWLEEVVTVSTKLSADGAVLTVTVVEVHYEANGVPIDNPYPQYPVRMVAGDTFTATFEHPRLLNTAAIKVQNPDASIGNPYLCGTDLAPEYRDLCGA